MRYKQLYKNLKGYVMRGGARKNRKRTTDTLSQLFKRIVSYGLAMQMKDIDAMLAWQQLQSKLAGVQAKDELVMEWRANIQVGGKTEEKLEKVVKFMKSGLGM